MADAPDILMLRNVGVTYDGRRWIFRNLNLRVEAQTICFIQAAPQSGRTTLLEVCGGLLAPTEGELHYRGVHTVACDYAAYQRLRRETGFIFSRGILLSNVNVYGNVALPLRYFSPEIGEAEIDRRVMAELEFFEIVDQANAMPATLNPDHRRRASMAAALASEPAVVLIDDPFEALDRRLTRRLIGLVKTLREERGVTFILAGDESPLNHEVADDILTLEEGALRHPRATDSIHMTRRFVRSDPMLTPAAAPTAAAPVGATIPAAAGAAATGATTAATLEGHRP